MAPQPCATVHSGALDAPRAPRFLASALERSAQPPADPTGSQSASSRSYPAVGMDMVGPGLVFPQALGEANRNVIWTSETRTGNTTSCQKCKRAWEDRTGPICWVGPHESASCDGVITDWFQNVKSVMMNDSELCLNLPKADTTAAAAGGV